MSCVFVEGFVERRKGSDLEMLDELTSTAVVENPLSVLEIGLRSTYMWVGNKTRFVSTHHACSLEGRQDRRIAKTYRDRWIDSGQV
jgi:hypothetical protein